jgi:hypothetical protein
MTVTVLTLADAVTLVYDGTPAIGVLVASRSTRGPGRDPFGNDYPGGEWCRDGYELVPMWQVWPGMLLRPAPARKVDQL